MNLIEEFGSYEKAKKIVYDPLHPNFTHVSNDGRHWVNEEFSHIPSINEKMKGMVKISEIRHALLEYRRENKIYEAGDKIVYLDEPILRSVIGVKTVKLVKRKSLWAYSGVKHDQATEVYFCQIRHATDLEIQAGHRLP